MRRISLLLICCFILLCAGCSQRDNNEKKDSATDAAVASGEAESGGDVSDASVAVAGVMTGEAVIGENKKSNAKEKRTIRIVMDPTGKKRKLKMGKVNVKNEGIKFYDAAPPSEYAQVYDGHYYYLRSDGSGNYTIYRDKGHKVGQFSLKGGYVGWFTKYGSDFYAITRKEYMYKTKKDWEAVEYPEIGFQNRIVFIDLKKKEAVPLCDAGRVFDHNFYENSLIYYNEKTGIYVKSSIKDKNTEIPIPIPAAAEYYTTSSDKLKLIDGKWYYGTRESDVITLCSLDLASWKREELFSYKFKEKYDWWDYDCAFMKMDNDYIYSIDYIIPLAGGRMTKLPGKVWRETVCSNKKYIYYIDEEFRIHRITKKTLNHTVISGLRAVDVQCTENCVYATGYHKKYYGDYFDDEDYEFEDEDYEYDEDADFFDEEEYYDKEDLIDYSPKKAKRKLKVNKKENPDSFDLYCMDLDGNHRKRLWKGKIK